jgi:putative oxidoreductase
MALDLLPQFAGYWEIIGGILLFVGLLSRPTALISTIVAIATYFYSAAPRGPWPIRNGGNEVLLYALVFAYIALQGGGVWSLDRMVQTTPPGKARKVRPATVG